MLGLFIIVAVLFYFGDIMISVNNVRLQFGGRVLFEDVNLKFEDGYCYGLIGANGAGKSTFLKLITKQIEPSSGDIVIQRGSVFCLQQDQKLGMIILLFLPLCMAMIGLWKL